MDTEKLTAYADYLLQCAMYKADNLNDAGDLVQETFLAALTAMEKGKKDNQPFRPDNLKAWLVTVLNRKYYDSLRRKYRRHTVSIDVMVDVPDESDPCAELEDREEAEKIRRCLGRLTKAYREVMVQYYVYGRSVKEISARLGVSESTVKNRLCTGREHIRKDYAMEKFTKQSYEPETLWVGESGTSSSDGAPCRLVGNGRIEMNLLILAYEKPVTLPELADAVGISTVYIEPIVDKLVRGELMKRVSDRVYTDFIIHTEEDRTANLERELALADRLYAGIWEIMGRGLEALEKTAYYGRQRHAAGLKLQTSFALRTMVRATDLVRDEVCGGPEPYEHYPDRHGGGKWYAIGSRYPAGYDFASCPYSRYNISGEVGRHIPDCCGLKELAGYEYDTDEELFGKTHRGYGKCGMDDIYKMLYCVYSGKEEYLSFIDKKCMEKTEELIAMNYLSRGGDGKLRCEAPVLYPEERKEFCRLCDRVIREIREAFGGEIESLMKRPVRLPAHLKSVPDWQRYMCCCQYFPTAVLFRAKEEGLFLKGVEGPAPTIMLVIRE